MESPEDKYSRLEQMIADTGETWDLSPSDKAALQWILGVVNDLANQLAHHQEMSDAYIVVAAGGRVHDCPPKEIESPYDRRRAEWNKRNQPRS